MAESVIVTVAMKKGGVGKTTTAVNIATAFSSMGHDVGVIDLDSQGTATRSFGCELSDRAAEVLLGERTIDSAWIPTLHGPRLIPSGPGTEGAEKKLASDPIDGLSALKRAIQAATTLPEIIIIDTRPDENHGVLNALVASNVVWAVVEPVPASVESLPRLLQTVERVRAVLNPTLSVGAIVPTRFDARTTTHSGILEALRRRFGAIVTAPIPMSIKVIEAHGAQRPLATYAPLNPAAIAYADIARSFITHLTPSKAAVA